MAIKKSELYSSLWESCDELRGGMDASQYKDYILVLLFVKYVSDKYAGNGDTLIEVPEGGSFQDMIKLKGNKDIGDKMNKIISKLAEANDLKGVIDISDFNDDDKLGRGQEMVDRLTKLVGIFENPALNFSKNRAEGDDLLGDAYEYLMRHFATESGKSKGQFYTPAEVSRVIARVIGIREAKNASQTIYDPTCGSGSLLLKAADEAPTELTIYGQENDNSTAALAMMNMYLHDTPTADIWKGNTLAAPHWTESNGRLKTFDFAVANPPFSTKSWKSGSNPEKDIFERFADGIPPAKNGDYAFLLHVIRSLKSTGKGAIILPHGVLFRGNAEAEIRKNILKKGYIKGIIGLPANLFYGTGIPACIIVLDKENAADRTNIFMIDASKDFVKDGNKNRLRDQDIRKIVDVFNQQIEIPKYSRMVSLSEIEEKNEFNLNIPRYIDSSTPEDIHDIEAHLLGDIPNRDIDALDMYWQVYPTLRNDLFEPSEREGYSKIKVEKSAIRAVIYEHPEFNVFSEKIAAVFKTWQTKHTPALKKLTNGFKPKDLIKTLAKDILQDFEDVRLIDKYDVYQYLMAFWAETMQDDIYLVSDEDWKAGNLLSAVEDNKDAELALGKKKLRGELIPASFIVKRYFNSEQLAIEQLEAKKEEITRQKEELIEEHTGEEGLLEEVVNDKGNITKGDVNKRIKAIQGDPDAEDELAVLKDYLALVNQEAQAGKAIKEADKTLAEQIVNKYPALTEDEIKTLVVEDKWIASLREMVESEMERISQALAQRIKELTERYETPIPQLQGEVEELSSKVEGHLKKMGFEWK